MRNGQEKEKPQKMVRSSIACARCRRSKVKCVNTGVTSVCKACSQSHRECTYPVAGSTPTLKRPEALTGVKLEDGSESKKRIRKFEDGGRRNSHKIGDDPLDSPILTRKVWDELYDIFKLHFSTELPFLHPPSFRNRMKQVSFPRGSSTSSLDFDDAARIQLLGVLALTARFHPALVAHHSSNPNQEDPLAASEYYASALATAFGPTLRSLARPSLENVQGLLMLGLHEWGQTRGLSAWLYIGTAVRLAQSMGFDYEDDLDLPPPYMVRPESLKASADSSAERDLLTEREIRRRTVWSCFIMDRMLSSGRNRPTMMNTYKFRVQLPCSEEKFLFVKNVKTGFLNANWMKDDQLKSENATVYDDGALSRYIRLVEIFGRLSEWSYAGGRRTEKMPPWDQSTRWYQLNQQLEDFDIALPSDLAFTKSNLYAHIETRNATAYASMHTLYCLCLIMLHREYIPFIPVRCTKPAGPVDEPTFPEDQFEIPPGFWDASAQKIMKASRDIIEIVRTCLDHDALPESPQMGFAVWQASFVCLYATYFPHMDTCHYLNTPDQVREEKNIRKKLQKGFPLLTTNILKEMAPRLKMVKGYLNLTKKMQAYYEIVLRDFVYRFKCGGGLELYKQYEKVLMEFGELRDNGTSSDDETRSRASTSELQGTSVTDDQMSGVENASGSRQSGNGVWAAINASSPTSTPIELEDRPKFNNSYGHGPSPYGAPAFKQSPIHSSSNPPSLISASNGDSSSGLNSPFNPMYQTQPQHAATYPSIHPHSMAPPAQHMQFVPQDFEMFIKQQESINIAGFDNMGQEYTAEGFPVYVSDNQWQTNNYLQAIHNVNLPSTMVAGQGWS